MKTLKQVSLIMLILTSTILAFGQMAVVEYMKVKPGDGTKYMNTEIAWKKIHDARMKAGLIDSWTLYETMFSGADDPYQYAVVTVYKNLAAYEVEGFDVASKAAYPDYDEKDWDDFFAKTSDSRVLSHVEVYFLETGAANMGTKPPKYLTLSAMDVKPGGDDAYLKLEKDYYKPMHEAMIKAGNMEDWSIWSKWPGTYNDFQYMAVNEYSSLDQMSSSQYEDIFKKEFPTMKLEDLSSKTNAARTITENMLWKRIDSVSKN